MEKLIALFVGLGGAGIAAYLFSNEKGSKIISFSPSKLFNLKPTLTETIVSQVNSENLTTGFIEQEKPFQFVSEAWVIANAKMGLKNSMIAKEGFSNTVYCDGIHGAEGTDTACSTVGKKGILTVGIGHRVLNSDNLKLGQSISDNQVNQFYEKDIKKSFDAAIAQAKELNKFTSGFIVALTHVNFQLGTNWRSNHKNTWAALKSNDYQTAINEIKYNSLWAKQTPVRVQEFAQAIYKVYT